MRKAKNYLAVSNDAAQFRDVVLFITKKKSIFANIDINFNSIGRRHDDVTK